jgi:ubiquinol-cytochrome c reductase cytochrome b subunit
MHMLTLHTNGSSNPLGVSSNSDKLPMHPYFIFKDLMTLLAFFGALALVVLYGPNLLGHSDNYIPANPLSTPASISPHTVESPLPSCLKPLPWPPAAAGSFLY